ncbi:MAG: GIY-YIG nuclease family protein [Halanaerobiaceae bacterium]|nr:GIY-YIG nuclease family protein [Halanaerobiaceae bacterium]
MAGKKHYVYIVKCSDNTLYTGYTVDLERRIKEHNEGRGSRYTRGRLPVKLEYFEEYEAKGRAMKREYEIKQMTRMQKEKLLSWF